jgi:hypothetical protein
MGVLHIDPTMEDLREEANSSELVRLDRKESETDKEGRLGRLRRVTIVL